MKDTNAIEKALKKKVDREIELIVDSFVNTIEIQLRTKYNHQYRRKCLYM